MQHVLSQHGTSVPLSSVHIHQGRETPCTALCSVILVVLGSSRGQIYASLRSVLLVFIPKPTQTLFVLASESPTWDPYF